MRPYLAIIKDSFRAAMASRVLYVLLLLITLLLLALAPLHMRETLDWELKNQGNITKPDQLLRRIVERRDAPREKGIARIWEMLPSKTQKKMLEIVERPEDQELEDEDAPGRPPQVIEDIHTYEELIEELNTIIEDPTFYRAEDWEGRSLPQEAEELVSLGAESLTEIRSKRLNRLLIASAVSPTIDTGTATSLDFYYAVWKIPINVSVTHQQFAQGLTSELPVYFDKFVMSIGLLIAILVTANMVPETFEPGSLNLLLSKPISRWGLYTSKFAGGCVFIAVCACYLFLGVWLWLGIGMGVWDRAILFSIPLYIVVFAIYFSVSAFVGLVWRSPIVAVILTLLFWATCFTIGSIHGFARTKMQNSEFVNMMAVGDDVYASDLLHQFNSWDESGNKWNQELEAELGEQGAMAFGINSYFVPLREVPAFPGLSDFLPPIYDGDNARIITSRYEFGKSLSSGKKKMFASDIDKLDFKELGYFPRDTAKLFNTKSGIFAVSSNGSFYRLNTEKYNAAFANADSFNEVDSKPKADKSKDKDSETEESMAEAKATDSTDDKETKELTTAKPATKTKKPAAENVELFEKIGSTNQVSIRSPDLIDYNVARDEFVAYRNGQLSVHRAKEGGYEKEGSIQIDLGFGKNMTTKLAAGGNSIVLAFGNGQVITLDAQTLEEKNDYQPETRSGIRQVIASPSGKLFLILYRNGNLWELDADNDQQIRKADIIGQGDVATAAFAADDEVWVSENTDRATRYNLAGSTRSTRLTPSGDWIHKLFRYGIRPFYKIAPKPGEFYKVVTHLSSSGDTEANENVDLNKTLAAKDPWSPLWSGLGFMLGMLFLGVLVFQFKDY